MGTRSLILYHVAARSAEDLLQSGSADVQTPQHIDAIVPQSLIQDRQHSHNLRSATMTLCQPATTTTFAKRAYTDALHQLSGTHYRKLSLIVTLLLSLSLGYRHSSSPGLSLSPFLSSTLPDLTALYKYVNYYMGILIAHNNNNNDRLTAFDPGQPG